MNLLKSIFISSFMAALVAALGLAAWRLFQHPSSLPSFGLEDAEGRVLRSGELTGKPALWMFFRGNWCPFCMAQIREVAAQYRTLAARGVEVFLIGPQPQGHRVDLAKRFDRAGI